MSVLACRGDETSSPGSQQGQEGRQGPSVVHWVPFGTATIIIESEQD